MNKKLSIALFFVVFISTKIFSQTPTNFPQYMGSITDAEGIFTPVQKVKLTELIAKYEKNNKLQNLLKFYRK